MSDPRSEVIAKVKRFVDAEFGGDYRAAFVTYNTESDGLVHRNGLMALMRDSHVGNWFTRDIYANEALKVLDLNHDNGVSWEEFQTALAKT